MRLVTSVQSLRSNIAEPMLKLFNFEVKFCFGEGDLGE